MAAPHPARLAQFEGQGGVTVSHCPSTHTFSAHTLVPSGQSSQLSGSAGVAQSSFRYIGGGCAHLPLMHTALDRQQSEAVVQFS
jgi:hypothetical protein